MKHSQIQNYWFEKGVLAASFFLFAFGLGLVFDGKRRDAREQSASYAVDYRSTLNPYRTPSFSQQQ